MEGTKNIPRLKFRFWRNCCSIFRLPTFATVSSLTMLKKTWTYMFDASCYRTQIMSTKFHASCSFLQLFNFISIGSNDGFTLQKKFASKGEHMFIYPLEATPHTIWNHLFFFFLIQKFSFDRAKKKIMILPSFYFGFIVLVLSVMLPESTPIKMKLFRVNQRKIDDVHVFYSGPSLKLNEKERKKKEKETPAVFK